MTILPPEDRYILAGAIKTRYWDVGDAGPVVILLHGLGASAEVWLPNIWALAKHYRVIVPDLAGFGRSDRPDASFSPLDAAYFVDAFLGALKIERASFVGQSLGGGVALKYTLQFPHKVDKLILANNAGFGREVTWSLRLLSLPWIGELITYPTRASVALFFTVAVRNSAVITKEFIDTYYTLFRRPGFQAFLLYLIRRLVDVHGARKEMLVPILENLHTITQETLIIWGEDDRVFPLRHAYTGREAIPRAQLYIVENCGHIPNLEKPEEFNRVVLDFLAGIYKSPSPRPYQATFGM